MPVSLLNYLFILLNNQNEYIYIFMKMDFWKLKFYIIYIYF